MGENNWDLQAVVRSCITGSAAAMASSVAEPFSSTRTVEDIDNDDSGGGDNDKKVVRFPNLSSAKTALQELYKPFFQSPPPPPPPRPLPIASQQQPLFLRQQQLQSPFSDISRSKKRKKQQRKMVCQVPADGTSNDMWAWRKYGQKPIKGSPYPRGYYRCSSSKGCPARKQVERTRTDPGMLLITYTAEHNHPVPTHRNSLAGSIRQRLPSCIKKVNNNIGIEAEKFNGHVSSPSTPAMMSLPPKMEEEKEEDHEEGLLTRTRVSAEDDMLFMSFDELYKPTPSTSTSIITNGSNDQPSMAFSSSPWTTYDMAAAGDDDHLIVN